MSRNTLLVTILTLTAVLPMAAQSSPPESLGDLARQVRAQQEKNSKKATKVFTNDNLPAPTFGEAVNSQPAPLTPEKPASAPAETTSKPPTPPPAEVTGGSKPESPEGKVKTRDYWQGNFKAARADLAKAKELQQVSEDELNLLQIQQAREMDPNTRAEITGKVQDKQSEVNVNRATTEAAQKALDDLEREFKDSGAPDDWSQTD